jgi:M6 family metalloprotease-like protein
MVSHTNVYAVGSGNITPMAQTCDQQENNNTRGISGRRNSDSDDLFGDQELPSNPIEPGTPVGEVPILFILLLSLVYIIMKNRKRLASLLVLIIVATASYAVPARPGWQTKTQPDGTTLQVRLVGDEFNHYWQNLNGDIVQCDSTGFWHVVDAEAMRRVSKRRETRTISQPKKVGTVNLASRGLVILVNFQDASFNAANTQSAMNDLMNADSYTYNGATGSVRKYFSDQSDGQYTPQFDVVGPVTLPDYLSHYGGNDASGNDKLPGDMVVEACSIANADHGVDFTKYDNDGDGYVDFVYIIYAGKGEADGGADNTIWPHNWNLSSAYYYNNCSYATSARKFDGKTVDNYACSGEIDGETGKRTGIGTIAHEFSHVIGLPDLYDIDYGQNYENESTPGSWHIMDGGSYNNNGNTPPNYTIYDKYFLGWKTPINPGNTKQTLTLKAAGQDGYNAYQITTGNTLLSATNTTTAYYIENRQQSGWDAYVPGHGLVIWKVMYNSSAWNDNSPNDTDGTLRYTIVSASGKTTGLGTAADPFPGSKKVTTWQGISAKPLLNITETSGVISLIYIDNAECHSVLTKGTNCSITASSDCVANNTALTANITPADNSYDITSVSVTIGSKTLTADTDYTLSNNNKYLSINASAITGSTDDAITITATATKARWTYEVLYENATVSSTTGVVAKGGTLTLTVTPALGYILTSSDIQVESTDGATKYDAFTYEGTTLTIANVTADLAIYITPSIDPENAITFTRLTNIEMLAPGAQCILVYAETPAVAGELLNDTYLKSVTEGFTISDDKLEITTQKTTETITIFTLDGTTDAWTLSNSSGKKLSGTTNSLGWDGTNSIWTISVGSDGKTVMAVGGTKLYYNSSSPRFRTYTSAQKGLYLYINHSGEIIKKDPVITFTKTGNQTLKVGQSLANPATSTYGTVAYASSNTAVATVNENGLVEALSVGTTTITASVAEGTYNNAASASYQLTVQALPTYTVTWMANGNQFAQKTYNEGELLQLPDGTPTACTNYGREFVGWIAQETYSNETTAPTYIEVGHEVMENATYYAVYARKTEGTANVKTVTMSTFTSTAANIDDYISYAAAKGNAANDPIISNGVIRIYQNGGTLTINAKTGAQINTITIGSTMATAVTSQVDGGSTRAEQSIAANGKYTLSSLNANSVKYTCKGTTSNSRLYLNYLEVTYTAGTTTAYTYFSTDCSSAIDLTTAPNITFAEASKVLTIDETYTNTLTCNSSGDKTFSSSDASVATVDANGEVTALKAGATTITVAVAPVQGQFTAGNASYNLTVVRKTATPIFDVNQITLKIGESATHEVEVDEHDGAVAYSSSNEAIATVDAATGQVIGITSGLVTITATLSQTATYETATASYMVYVTSEVVSDGKFGVTWIVDGIILTDAQATHRYNSGEALKMPSTEISAGYGKEFVGWTAIKDYQNPFCPPADLFTSPGDKTVTANITYYAVYKKK